MNNKPYKLNKSLIYHKTGNNTVVFDGERSKLITLNETASYIVNLAKKGYSVDKIVDSLCKKYNVQKNIALKDTKKLIAQLEKNNLIK